MDAISAGYDDLVDSGGGNKNKLTDTGFCCDVQMESERQTSTCRVAILPQIVDFSLPVITRLPSGIH
jgi:hypothetical protein